MDVQERIAGIIAPSVEAMGYDLVRVSLTGNARPTLQIMAERVDGAAMTVDDCAEISRAVSALLDVEDPIDVAYTLEVSSPGIDRPLTRPKDFERFAGFEVRVETSQPVDDRRRFIGMLKGIEDGKVLVEMPTGPAAVPFDLILRAKLVMNDALLKAAAEGKHQH
ncbi:MULTISPECIES: ribosome maturation factor RimP [Nitrospirillum]|uniref:Ribosome maturation factor RimP n=2 Tax=Azospirillaceae TaxID=2829815 RepID=A0A560JWL7_9PROT|nr:ribosome maturation factor RimP [Nitrospirillum amazonense]MDG3440307.1 ribosome maturation factor RimP [Nitrospirillum amazonense]TWB54601.1 ribosome maturation factor RimP [Nitrospirillum amazonense]TWB75356.1 ribosome maturation factor RimP [Nitrospirillum amazonense]